jgi:hypothetical protein
VPRRQLLARLESAAIGTRAADGAIAVRRREVAGCILYGPYLHLAEGYYRLSFRCRCGRPRMAAQPVLGVEILVLSRFQQGWRDFTAAELASGAGSLDFEVPAELSLEGANEGRFEFRFFHVGNADLTISAVELEGPLAEAPASAAERRWRLLGRLATTWRGRRSGEGGVTVRRMAPAGCLLFGGWPYLRLPGGAYRLTVQAHAGRPRRPGEAVLGVELYGDSRWRGRRRLGAPAAPDGRRCAAREITAEAIAAGPITLDFTVPGEMALEAGADAPFDIRLHHRGNAALGIVAVELQRLGAAQAAVWPAPSLRPSRRRRVVIVGGFQSETLRQGFARIAALNERFDARYYYVQLPRNLHELAARDLEQCDILLAQDVQLWDAFPLRQCVRPGAEIIKYPLLRFASIWPFDGWNGPTDRDALAREAPDLAFPYLDGLLGRLRREIPDPEARFNAYRDLAAERIVNYRRLHQLEERRLAAMDARFGATIGDFILARFRRRRVFHTTVRPNWEVSSLLMQLVARSLGVTRGVSFGETLDAELRNPQVPVHPKVARDLGVEWADERTLYFNRGRQVTWESYIRGYIDHYG